MTERSHIASLDGLRGIAAIAVVIGHIGLVTTPVLPPTFADIGSNAVAIFFSLSGFLMAYLYGRRPLTRKSGLDFLVSRFARIYPVYLVAVVVVAALSVIPGLNYISPISGLTQIVRHVAMMGSTGVLWSVPPEIQFYLLFPLIWLCLGNPARYQSIGIAVAVFLAIDGLLGFPGSGILITSKLPYFLFGAVAGHLHDKLDAQPPGLLVGILALLLPAFILLHQGFLPNVTAELFGMSSAFAAAVAVSLVARDHPVSAAIFASPPLRFAGAISFSLYLFHMPVLFLTERALAGLVPTWDVIAIGLAGSLLVACFSYYAIEMPSRLFLVGLWRKHSAAITRESAPTLAQAPASPPSRRSSI